VSTTQSGVARLQPFYHWPVCVQLSHLDIEGPGGPLWADHKILGTVCHIAFHSHLRDREWFEGHRLKAQT